MARQERRKADEAAVQRFVRELLERGTFLAAIEGVDSVRQSANARRGDRTIPVLSIDSIQRERTILAADEALSALDQLEIVSDNTSISRNVGEILKPDFVLFNRRLGKIVLVELKDDALPEREAVAELLAYEREIRNHFPFLGQPEVVFVLIARHWSDLLTHAYAGLAARGRPALVGLTLAGEAPDFHLVVRSDEGWMRRYHFWIGSKALRSRSYFVTFPKPEEYRYIALLNAADLMRQTADRLGQHGFCFAWEKTNEPSGLGITVCMVDPAHLLHAAVEPVGSRRESDLTNFFEEVLLEEGIVCQPSLEATVDTLRRALGTAVSVAFLRDGHWSDDLEWLEQMGAELSEFRYWGMLADFSVKVATSSAGLQHYWLLDPPCVESAISGFQIITAMAGNQPFQYGRITAKSLFRFGRLLRQAVELAKSAEPDLIAWQWNQLRLVPFSAELTYLAGSWVDRTAPMEPLRLFAGPSRATADNFLGFRDWVASLLVGHLLLEVFEAGWRAGAVDACERAACDALSSVMARVNRDKPNWSACQSLLPEEMRAADDPAQLPQIITAMSASSAVTDGLLEVADRWVPHLERRQRFLEDVAFDLEDFRQGINDKLQTLFPDDLPCIFIGADGMVGTVVIKRPPEMLPVNHATEVAVLNRSSGRDLLVVYDWATLSDGRLAVLADNIVGNPLSLEDWRPVNPSSAAEIDNRWVGPKINLNHYGLHLNAPVGARFFNIALSENAPSEIAMVINSAIASAEQGGWDGQIHFEVTTGAIRFEGAVIGFLVLQIVTRLRKEWHTLPFDGCDRYAQQAIDYLGRQSRIHFIVAREDGEVVTFHECENTFKLGELRAVLEQLTPGGRQNQARSIIANRRPEIEVRLAPERIEALAAG